jgi:hypothetical protein
MSKDILFIDSQTIKDKVGQFHQNVSDDLINAEIKVAQDMYIQPALGSELYEKIGQGIEGDNLEPDYEKLLDTYITDPLIWYVLSSLPYTLSFQFYNKGLIRKESDNTVVPDMQDLVDISNLNKTRAEYYRDRLISYVKANKNKYPEYSALSTDCNDIQPINNSWETDVYLPDYERYCECKKE